MCASNGQSSLCTGFATPSTAKTSPRSVPGPGPGSWQPCETWPSAPCAWPDAPTSPKPPDGPAGQWTGHSPSSPSPNDLETAVGKLQEADDLTARLRQIPGAVCPEAL